MVTRDLEQAIQERFFSSSLRQWYCKHFSWSLNTYELIDWDLFSGVYSSYSCSRKFFYQVGWKKLPVGYRLHQWNASFDDTCPLCWQPHETDVHLVQCRHHNRQEWRSGFLRGLTTKLAPFLDPELLDMIRIGLSGYFSDVYEAIRHRFPDPDNPPMFETDTTSADESVTRGSEDSHSTSSLDRHSPSSSFLSSSSDSLFAAPDSSRSSVSGTSVSTSPAYCIAIQERGESLNPYIQLRQSQDKIGWDQFLRGKLATDWNRLQHRYARKNSKVEQSKNWLSWLIRYMASQFHSLWISRNKDRHGHDTAAQHQSKLAQARREISSLYSHRDHVLPHDRDLFCASLEAHLLQPLSQLHSWLALNKP